MANTGLRSGWSERGMMHNNGPTGKELYRSHLVKLWSVVMVCSWAMIVVVNQGHNNTKYNHASKLI